MGDERGRRAAQEGRQGAGRQDRFAAPGETREAELAGRLPGGPAGNDRRGAVGRSPDGASPWVGGRGTAAVRRRGPRARKSTKAGRGHAAGDPRGATRGASDHAVGAAVARSATGASGPGRWPSCRSGPLTHGPTLGDKGRPVRAPSPLSERASPRSGGSEPRDQQHPRSRLEQPPVARAGRRPHPSTRWPAEQASRQRLLGASGSPAVRSAGRKPGRRAHPGTDPVTGGRSLRDRDTLSEVAPAAR